jgi:hypothetical protein
MSSVNKQPVRVPLVDPNTGVITREWYRFFEQVFVRVGGDDGQTNNELAADLHDDAGIEEIKLDVYRIRDELNQVPPSQAQAEYQDQTPAGVFFTPTEDQSGRLEALEAQVQALLIEVEALKQGLL